MLSLFCAPHNTYRAYIRREALSVLTLPIFMTIENDEERSLAESLYLTYKSRMYGIAYAILHTREDAEDAVMDAVCSIVKNISLFSPVSRNKTEALIVVIVRNAAINRYHYKKRRNTSSLEETANYIPDSDPTSEEMFGQKEDYEGLLQAIRTLAPIYRDALLLKYLYEYDNGTIASVTGVAEATVRVRLMRAKEKLSELLKGGEPDGEK